MAMEDNATLQRYASLKTGLSVVEDRALRRRSNGPFLYLLAVCGRPFDRRHSSISTASMARPILGSTRTPHNGASDHESKDMPLLLVASTTKLGKPNTPVPGIGSAFRMSQ